MSKLKYLLIPAIIGALGAFPVVVSNGIDERLEANRVVFERNGLKQVMLNKSGYIDNVRTFSLEVTNTAKAKDFLLNKLVEKSGQYKLFAESLKGGVQEENGGAMDGLKFRGEMVNSNFSPTDIKISLILDKLPLSFHNELLQNKELGDALLPLITKGVFALDITLGSSEKLKDLQVKEVKLKDIKEHIKIDDVTLDVEALNHTLGLRESGGVLNGTLGVAKQDFNVTAEMFLLKSHLENLKYTFAYKDDFNNKSDFEAGKYAFEMAEAYSNVKFSLESIKASSSVEDSNQNLQIKADYLMNAITFMNEIDEIKVDNLLIKLHLQDVKTAMMKKLQEDYKTIVLGTGTPPSDEVLIADFVALINHGVKIDLGIGVKGMSGEINLKDVSIDTTLQIPKNNYTDKQPPLAILNLLEIMSKVKIHKEDRQTLEALSLSAPEDFAQGKPEGDFFVYDIVMKNGALSVNGKAIQ